MKNSKKIEKWSLLFFFASTLVICEVGKAQEIVAGKELANIIWQEKDVKVIDREIMVKVTTGNQDAITINNLESLGADILRGPDKLGWMQIRIPETESLESTVQRYKSINGVISSEPNIVTKTALLSNDLDSRQWALNNTGQSPANGTFDADIDIIQTWEISNGSTDIVIAILDTGIPIQGGSLSHPDLDNPNKIILGIDAIGDGQGVKNERGHGTHVAGIAAAETNNNTGISGTCWNCKIMPIQVFDANGSGTYQAFYDGVIYASDYQESNPGKKVVINYSGGGRVSSRLIQDAIEYADDRNVLIVASAGNEFGGSVLNCSRA